MILSWKREELFHLGEADLRLAILERRRSIRKEHRDQRGDDRCFLDDYVIWCWLADSPPIPEFTMQRGMDECLLFYEHRRSDTPDPVPEGALRGRRFWDKDIEMMSQSELLDQLLRIQESIREHRDVTGRPRTIDDDRRLYRVLPENLPADFRLPPREEFLGEARAPRAGCPSFWRSHGNCPLLHNLHQWGPCGGSSK